MNPSAPAAIILEQGITPARQTELGVEAWPVWKDAQGDRTLRLEATEQSYFLQGSATLTLEGGEPVKVGRGDLVVVPAGACHWEVHASVRRRYRSEALTPACCMI